MPDDTSRRVRRAYTHSRTCTGAEERARMRERPFNDGVRSGIMRGADFGASLIN